MTQFRVAEAAKQVGVSESQIRIAIQSGVLKATLGDSHVQGKAQIYYIDAAEIERFRRWRVKYRGAYYPDITADDLTDI